eukprot:m.78997 g.78997  ORF g.78997 m.78997 type:complete len:59 (+) comp50611_c0_seq6:25-201(+)
MLIILDLLLQRLVLLGSLQCVELKHAGDKIVVPSTQSSHAVAAAPVMDLTGLDFELPE